MPQVSPSSRSAAPASGSWHSDRCGMRERDGAAPRVGPPPDAGTAPGHGVIKWNQLLRRILLCSARSLDHQWWAQPCDALHIAIFDAVNSIERSFTPYFIKVRASRSASKQAAAAQAAP